MATSKTAFDILAALEGTEEVEQAVQSLPESEEVRRQRETRERLQRAKAEAKAQLAAEKQPKAKQLPPKINLPFELVRRTRMCDDWLKTGRCTHMADCVFAHDLQEMNRNRARVRAYQVDRYREMGYTQYAEQLARGAGGAFAAASHGGGHAGPSSSSSAAAAAGGGGRAGGVADEAGPQRERRREREPDRDRALLHPFGFVHDSFRPGGDNYKTRICRNWARQGSCQYGDKCLFAHGERELRAHVDDEAYIEDELVRWGVRQPRREAHGGSGPSSSAGGECEDWGPEPDYSYIDSLPGEEPHRAAAGQSFGPPPPPPRQQQAQPAPAPASMGVKQMDDAQLAALMEGLDFGDEEAHPAFLCPITHELMHDPVVAADGYTYERFAITHWISTRDTSPMTNEPLEDKLLIPNLTLKEAMLVMLGDEANW